MANVVFILGAGASVAGGCPVMANFLETSRRLALDQPDSSFAMTYGTVHGVQQVLQRANAKAVLDFENVESLFSAIEMGELLGHIGELNREALHKARSELLRLIAQTLDQTQKLNLDWASNTEPLLSACGPHDHSLLAGYIAALMDSKYHHQVSVITFNYDVGLEIAIGSQRIPWSYCLTKSGHKDVPESPRLVRICKLHGSLSWVIHDRSTRPHPEIYWFDPYAEVLRQTKERRPREYFLDTSQGRARISGHEPDEALPYIVPPGEGKSSYRRVVQDVWAEAYHALRSANVLFVCGYSMPPTDTFFTQLFGLGMINDSVVRAIRVVNTNPDATDRFVDLLGPLMRSGILQRNNEALIHAIPQWQSFGATNGHYF